MTNSQIGRFYFSSKSDDFYILFRTEFCRLLNKTYRSQAKIYRCLNRSFWHQYFS